MLKLMMTLIACASVAPCLAQDWPMFMGSPAHRGAVATSAAPDLGKFGRLWTIDLHAEISASPVIAGASMYVGAENGNLYAYNLADKSLQWLFHSRGGIGSTPAVAGGLVNFLSRDGRFYALDATTGAPRWTFQTLGESVFSAYGLYGTSAASGPTPDPWDFFLSSPVVHEGRVYFGSSDERVYALDAASGKLAWAFKTGGIVHSSPAVAGNTVLVGSWDGVLYALDAESGAERWRFKTETEQKTSVLLGIQSSPTVDKDTVYIGARDGYLYALDLKTGARKWRYDAKGSWIVGTPAVDAGKVYVGTSDTGLLVALDQQTGREIYRYDTRVWTYSSPLLVGDILWAANMKGGVVALQAGTGQQRWSYQSAEGKADAFRILDAQGKFDSARLFGTEPHQLHSALEHVKRLGAFTSSPVWYQGQLIIANSLGQIAGFGPQQ
jgi:outer membrane protein assembly factor BamB